MRSERKPTTAENPETVEESLVPVSVARRLLAASPERPIARATVIAKAARGEIKMHVVAGRFVITRESINAYRARVPAKSPGHRG